MEKPTDLKLHKFQTLNHDHSFIHGCYIRENICDDIISFFEQNPDRHNTGKIYGTCEEHIGLLVENDERKKSTDIYFDLNVVTDALLLNSYVFDLNKCIAEYEYVYDRARHMVNYGVIENINLQKYEPNEGFSAWHCERDGRDTQTRCLAFMTYLNDVPFGGTEFMYQQELIPARKGLTIIWPSDWTHTHRGQISNKYKKYILTGWLNYL